MSEQENQSQPEEQSTPLKKDWADIGIICLVAVLVVCLGGMSYYYFHRQGGGSRAVNGKLSMLEQQVRNDQGQIASLQHAVLQLQLATQQTQALTSKQEQIIGDWQAVQKGDMNKWYMSEAQYLVRLANDHAQYTHNIGMALTLLQRADQVLLPMQDTSAIEIRQSIASSIAALQALPQVNTDALYMKLATLDGQFNQLPLNSLPIKPNTAVAPPSEPEASWWKAGLNRTLEALQKIVIVRQSDSATLPLVLPEEKNYLYQSLHAEMQNTMWAALHHQPAVYQASLDRQIAWVHQYFMVDSPATQDMLNQLTSLRNVNIQPQTMDLVSVLQLFNTYFSRTGTV